ncbi:MAG: hypothetical protein HQL72_06985 [Magnetococcales bacterium]|nr:hypothetical protein [Magnetococcales bacterium]
MRKVGEVGCQQLALIRKFPLVYDELLARLELDGLSLHGPKDSVQIKRFNRVLAFFVYRLSLESLEPL